MVGLWLRTLLAVYYNYGWRRAEAAQHLEVGQIDLVGRTILLSRRSTKNKEPKRARMSQEVFELLSACVEGKKKPEDGSPAGDFRKAWRSLRISVGLGRCCAVPVVRLQRREASASVDRRPSSMKVYWFTI